MKIQFDSRQDYQLGAIGAVIDLFTGQAHRETASFLTSTDASGVGFGNALTLSDTALLENLQKVQVASGLAASTALNSLDFSVEMETGTGKTYVYLRTILELHKRYGFAKFIIVVPSVAIREGVLKSLQLMREHFALLFDNVAYTSFVYDSRRLSQLRSFHTNNSLHVMVMNLDAFNKDSNVIRNDQDNFGVPLELIQGVNPIVVLDEPQNMESDRSKEAIASLNPLLTLRYSATHREAYNLVYRLGPIEAYELGLVKQIEVASVLEDSAFNRPYISVKDFKTFKNKAPTVMLELDTSTATGVKRKTLTIKNEDDLAKKTGRDLYSGYIISDIDAGDGYIAFSNGIRIDVGQSFGDNKDGIMEAQVRETVREHLDKELRFLDRPVGERLKVLSLFFIDRVANYYTENGKIRRWFESAYAELSGRPAYARLDLPPVSQVHNGYFATTAKGDAKDTSGVTKDDDRAYQLIMRDKEKLLEVAEPLRFIFSHSALREGWDNPNVFQICTLNDTYSEVKKRQEIGRGLRLPVLESGERSFDATVNRVTVIANESYETFAKALQLELSEETGAVFDKPITKNARERKTAKLNKQVLLGKEFGELWGRISQKTRYRVEYTTADLVAAAAKAIAATPEVSPQKIKVLKGRLGRKDFSPTLVSARSEVQRDVDFSIPDLLGILQRETELTRTTLAAILEHSGRLGDLLINPQEFTDAATRAINQTLEAFMIGGIKYQRLEGETYEMKLFEDVELSGYLSSMLEVQKSVYDWIVYDSAVELEFAKKFDGRDDIRCFVKLPNWFKVETPIGTYNPDWAIVKQDTGLIYLVRETKSTTDLNSLRLSEKYKIACAKVHFEALGAVNYAVVANAEDV